MTVTASPLDIPGVYGQDPGKGTQVLNAVAGVQATVNAAPASSVQLAASLAQLNLLQIEAVDYFMQSYWVAADQIIATFLAPAVNATATYITALQAVNGSKFGAYITAQLAMISARAAAVAALVAKGLPTSTIGNQGVPQYSIAYLPYQVPDTYWYQLNTQLVDFLMVTGILPASLILSTMTGVQTYPFNYNTNGQFFSPYGEGDVDIIG